MLNWDSVLDDIDVLVGSVHKDVALTALADLETEIRERINKLKDDE